MDLHCFRRPGADTLERLFRMSFVPAGFWERFIARMLISLTDMDLQVHLRRDHFPPRPVASLQDLRQGKK